MKPRSLNGVRTPSDIRPLGDALCFHVDRDPDAPAVTLGQETLTRAELHALSDRYAATLRDLGVQQDDLVTVCLPNGPEHHAVSFAIWKLGGTPSPVSHRLPAHELEAIVALSRPRLVVAMEGLEVAAAEVVRPAQLGAADFGGPPPRGLAAKYLKATTSGGSTGRPKVIVDHQPATIDPLAPWLGLEVDDVVLHPSPLYHNAPFLHTNLALCWGCHVIEMSRFDALEWLQLVETHRVRWAYLVPTMMSRILALPNEVRLRYDVSSLEFVVHMAAMCPIWVKARWIEWLGPEVIWDVYGGTEGIGGTAINGTEWLEKRGSVGRLWIGKDLQVLGPDGQPLPPGEVGEVRFTPPNGPPRYHYLGAEPAAAGRSDTYGDLGWLDDDGYLFLADRRTDMITVGGANVYPAEVEAVLDSHPDVLSSLVVGLPDDDLGHRLHAIVQLRPDVEAPPAAELATFLKAQLVSYKRPRTAEFVSHPLRDDAGKARRLAYRDERAARWRDGERFVALN